MVRLSLRLQDSVCTSYRIRSYYYEVVSKIVIIQLNFLSPFYGTLQVQLFYKLSMTAENTTDLANCNEYYEKVSGNFIFLSKTRRQSNRKRIINRMLAAKTILHFERNTNGRLATGTIMAVAVIKCDCYRVIYLCPSRDRSCTTYCMYYFYMIKGHRFMA